MPELAGPVLFHEGFDWAYYVGLTNEAVDIANYGTLRESWTGMALQRSGPVTPFVVSALAPTGHTNVASSTESAVCFWLTPYWASPAVGGTGPGQEATLLELVATDGQDAATLWSLRTRPDGSALVLLAPGDAGPIEVLRADIAWTPSAHCLALNFGPDGTALFVDGALAAKGPGTSAVLPNLAGLVFGSTWTGNASAEADLDELHVFGRPLSELAMAWHYVTHAGQAALGPVSEAEWQAQRDLAAKRKAERDAVLASAGGGGAQTMRLLGPTSTCLTNVPVDLTNVVVIETNTGWTVTFEIQGTNAHGPLQDIFTTTNLSGDNITNSQWAWLERGPSCSTYQYTFQPDTFAFYVLGTLLDSDNDGLTDAYEQLVSKTSPTNADSPRAFYEGVISNQNPSAWFKLNDSSFTNSAASGGLALTNQSGGWAPDVFAYGNSAYSFTNTTDRLVVTNDAIGGGTSDATNQGSFTLVFKALTRQATSKRYVLSQGTSVSPSSGNAIAVYFDGTGTNGALKVGVGPNEPIILQDSNLVRGAWYYLAVTCDETRTNTNDGVRWYLGPVGSQTLQAGSFALGGAKKFGTTGQITLGNKESSNSAFRDATSINGSIDQVAFWKRELTEAEVSAQFNALYPLFQGPAKVFDLSRWNLLLPVDKTNGLNTNNLALQIDTGWLNSGFKYLNPTNWTQQYFYLSNGNTMVFETPWNGARSSTNGGPRSELRETQADGSDFDWQPFGTNTLEATCAVHSAGTNNNQKVIIGQIHSDTTKEPPFVLSYNFPSNKNLTVTAQFHPDGSGTPRDTNFTLATGVNLGDLINYELKLERIGGSITVGAVVNGTSTNVNVTAFDSNWTNQTFYFKAGSYFPSSTNGTGKVTFSSLSATHQ